MIDNNKELPIYYIDVAQITNKIYKTKVQKYIDYSSILIDLESAKFYFEKSLEGIDNKVQIACYKTAVIEYCKIFDHKNLGRKNSNLSKKQLKKLNLDPALLKTHDLIIEIRNQVIAHHGNTNLYQIKLGIALNSNFDDRKILNMCTLNVMSVKSPDSEIKNILIIIEESIKFVNQEGSKLYNEIILNLNPSVDLMYKSLGLL